MRKQFHSLFVFVLILGLAFPSAVLAAPEGSVTPGATVFINEIHYDNTSTDVGEAIEIAGPAGTDLTGWSIVLYNGSNGASYDTDALSGPIPDSGNGFGFVTVNYPSNGIQNGPPDGIALVNNGSVVMFLSYEGTFTAAGGAANGLTSTDIGVSENGSEPIGLSLQLTGSGTTYDDFTWAAAQPHTFGAVNTDQSFGVIENQPVALQCGAAISLYEGGGGTTRTITAQDEDGTVTSITLDSVDPAAPITLGPVTPAAEVGGTASADLSVDASIMPGTYTVTLSAANNDAEPQTATCSLIVTVQEVLTIGEVQGETTDEENGLTDRSPYAPPSGNGNGQTVVTRGVIYQKTAFLSNGIANYGFFIQNTDATDDDNPLSSDGIFVYHSRFTTLLREGTGSYIPQVGDEVLLRGPVVEYFNMSQLNNPRLLAVLRSGVDVNAEIPVFEANPPDDLAEANRYWERHEGARAQVAAGSISLDGRDVFLSSMDAEVWVAHPNSAIAQREDPYTRRSFRDPHPLDDIPDVLFDNGNGYRIILGSHGLKAAQNDINVLLAPARTFDTLTNTTDGGVYFSFSKYQIMVQQQIELAQGVDPAQNAPPQPADTEREYAIANYNLENLYDFRDDPTDGCDFAGNAGCPDVDPPFDYVPASQADYDTRVGHIAEQIVGDLHSPDLIMVQEVEDQDICALVGGSLECGLTSGADGQPDPLQDLAAAVLALGGPQYLSAYDSDGADDRGIVAGFLYRADRVELLPVDASHPILGSDPLVEYRSEGLPYNSDVQNPKALNAVLPDDVDTSTGQDGDNVFTRAPQVGWFRVWRDGIGQSVFTDLYAVSNHFSSTPDARVGQRTEQAAYNAAIVEALQMVDPETYITVGGDLNVYPRPDDPFTPGHPRFPSDQLGPLYEQGLVNLYDILLAEVPVSAYSYIYQGQTQTLDQMFASQALLAELEQVRVAHINADWPADYYDDSPRGTSDHDPEAARYLNLPTLDRLEALVYYFAENGMITGNNTVKILIDRLERARKFQEKGQMSAYDSQLAAFVNQVQGFTPRFITLDSASALIKETEFLRMID